MEVRLSSYQTLRISVLKASDLTDIYKLCRNRVIQSQDTNNFHLPLTQVDLNCGRFVPGPFHNKSFRPKVGESYFTEDFSYDLESNKWLT